MLPIHPQENNREAVVNLALSQRAINTAFFLMHVFSFVYFYYLLNAQRYDNLFYCSCP